MTCPWMRKFLVGSIFLFLQWHSVYANDASVNIYAWSQEIPNEIIEQFEQETGIKVNYAPYDSNEIMFAKLRTNPDLGYDLVEPSNYYVERMIHLGMLQKLDKTHLSGFKNLDPFFTHPAYDEHSDYSIPFVWGTTGIYCNEDYFSVGDVDAWKKFLSPQFANQLLILDDAREVFSTALLILGYSANDNNPTHLKEAYLVLKKLLPNVRVFNMDAATSILIDEDATVGMAMSGDLFNAHTENARLQYIYPKEGFIIWVDNFVLLKNAPHPENAYLFLNFLLRPDIAKAISLSIGYSTTNLAAINSMPPTIKNNLVLYPPKTTLQRGEFQKDIGEPAFNLIEEYWEQLKMGT